jgi:hypothetical protein
VRSTTAAAPSTCEGQHCSSVSGSAIMREASTSSTVVSVRCWAYSFSEPWRRFFTATVARSAGVADRSCRKRVPRIAYTAGSTMPAFA